MALKTINLFFEMKDKYNNLVFYTKNNCHEYYKLLTYYTKIKNKLFTNSPISIYNNDKMLIVFDGLNLNYVKDALYTITFKMKKIVHDNCNYVFFKMITSTAITLDHNISEIDIDLSDSD